MTLEADIRQLTTQFTEYSHYRADFLRNSGSLLLRISFSNQGAQLTSEAKNS